MPPAEPVSGSRLLVADVGGTNARFAIADLETLALSDIEEFQCARHSSLVEAMRAYLDRLDDPPAEAAIAVAGPVVDDRVSLTNSAWSFTKAELCSRSGLNSVLVLNDIQALALSISSLDGSDLHRIGGSEAEPWATKLVLAAGTGMGASTLVCTGARWLAVPGEGGHISFAAHTKRERDLIDVLYSDQPHVPVDRVVSGPGLAILYQAIAKLDGEMPRRCSLTTCLRADFRGATRWPRKRLSCSSPGSADLPAMQHSWLAREAASTLAAG